MVKTYDGSLGGATKSEMCKIEEMKSVNEDSLEALLIFHGALCISEVIEAWNVILSRNTTYPYVA